MTTLPRPERWALAHAVRDARRRRGMSQERVALEAGLQRTTVHQVENAKVDPRLGTLCSIAIVVGVPVGDLLTPPE